MKKLHIIYIAFITSLGFLGASCQDFLEEEPISSWGVDAFYSSPIEADIAIAGIYSNLASDAVYGQALSIVMESGTDEGYYNRRFNDNWTVGLYRHTSADEYVKNLWYTLYSTINLSNLFIEKLDASAFEQVQYDQLIAEARFLRAHSYFLLTSWYNEVPMPLKSTEDQSSNDLPVSTLEELYAQIIEDFSYAAENLPVVTAANYKKGRAHKMAAHGLMARVYLKMAGFPFKDASKYKLAMDECEIVIADGKFNLNPSYRAHFLNYIQIKYDTQESIFEISFAYLRDLGLDTHGRIGGLNGVAFGYGGSADGYPAAYAMFNASPNVKNAYSSDDQRKAWNLAEFQYSASGDAIAVTDPLSTAYCPGKYRRWEPANFDDLLITATPGVTEPYILLEAITSPNKNFTSINFPVLRYSDILLMYAEASNEVEGAPTSLGIEYLNKVRNRAGLLKIEDENPSAIANKTNFFNELVDERLREFCFEGLRKQDLIRWELLGTKLKLLNNTILGEPTFKNSNEDHKAYLRAGNFFNESKNLSLPYPLQEVQLNNLLTQKPGW